MALSGRHTLVITGLIFLCCVIDTIITATGFYGGWIRELNPFMLKVLTAGLGWFLLVKVLQASAIVAIGWMTYKHKVSSVALLIVLLIYVFVLLIFAVSII